jgi:Flp pilus assembly protein TadD
MFHYRPEVANNAVRSTKLVMATLLGLFLPCAGCAVPFAAARNKAPEAGLAQLQLEALRRHVEEGAARERHGDERLAREAYLKAIRIDPNIAFVHHRLGILADRAGQFAEAEKHYRAALSSTPNNPDILNDLGYSYYLSDRLAPAEQALRDCLQLEPRHSRAHNNLGLVLARAGQRDESIGEFRRAGASEEQAVASFAFAQASAPRQAGVAESAPPPNPSAPRGPVAPRTSNVYTTQESTRHRAYGSLPQRRPGPEGDSRAAQLVDYIEPVPESDH